MRKSRRHWQSEKRKAEKQTSAKNLNMQHRLQKLLGHHLVSITACGQSCHSCNAVLRPVWHAGFQIGLAKHFWQEWPGDEIIITHGTDTLIETAQYLGRRAGALARLYGFVHYMTFHASCRVPRRTKFQADLLDWFNASRKICGHRCSFQHGYLGQHSLCRCCNENEKERVQKRYIQSFFVLSARRLLWCAERCGAGHLRFST